jgi:hypothetical protein
MSLESPQPTTNDATSAALSERRKNARFGLQFDAILWSPSAGSEWLPSQTIEVGLGGSSLQTRVALPEDSQIEYVVTFPSELTHANQLLRVKFIGQVVRVEPKAEDAGCYLVAVHNTNYKYLRGDNVALGHDVNSSSEPSVGSR